MEWLVQFVGTILIGSHILGKIYYEKGRVEVDELVIARRGVLKARHNECEGVCPPHSNRYPSGNTKLPQNIDDV